MRNRAISLPIAAAACLLPLHAAAENMRIDWPDLLPANALPIRQKMRPAPATTRLEHTLSADLDGKTVELSGYLLPADREGDLVYAFMLVPAQGACSHMTQPPPSQVVRVVPEKPYRLSMNYEPVSVTGTISASLEKTQLFILDGVAVIESGYRMRDADVVRTASASGKPSRPGTPRSFLEKVRVE